jgi:hypothetical protein
MPKQPVRRASEIYTQQNKILHMAMARAGYPYHRDPEVWLGMMTKAEGQPVSGLSKMTLGGRDRLIKALQQKYSRKRIYNPPVPKRLHSWKKGDPERSYTIRQEEDGQLRMIFALWVELGYEPDQLREMVKRMFRREDVRWLDGKEKIILLNVLRGKLQKKGQPEVYYPNGMSEEEAEAEQLAAIEKFYSKNRAERRAERREG